jgi:hypothetical protein
MVSLLFDDAQKAIKRVENILRGQAKLTSTEVDVWTEECYAFYYRASSKDSITQYEGMSASEKVKYLEIAIKLYNKVRNIPTGSYAEVRTILKGACAWMFSLFAERTGKAFSVLLKTLSKCGMEFLNTYGKPYLALECFDAVAKFWRNVEEIGMLNDLPNLELYFIKSCVFNCCLYQVEHLDAQGDSKELKATLSACMELAQSLSIRHKLILADKFIFLGQRSLTNVVHSERAVKLFVQARDLLDSPKMLSAGEGMQEMTTMERSHVLQEITDCKVKVYLYLAFFYAELK